MTTTTVAAPPLDIRDIHSENLVEDNDNIKVFPRLFTPMEQELVVLLTGPRGSMKSLMAGYIGISEMANDSTVYSNLPIDTHSNFTDLPRLRSNELDIVNLYSMGKDIDPGSLYILDEFDKICAARWSSTSNINRVLDWLATQIRKFGVSFVLTAQNYWHIDSMWRDQIDIVVFCKDLKHTPWGKKKGLARGELGFIECYDKSGFEHGTENDPYTNPYAQPYAAHYIQGKPLWGTYDTRKLLGINEMLRRLRFVKDDVKLGQGGIVKQDEELNCQSIGEVQEREKGEKVNYVRSVLTKLVADGKIDTTLFEVTRLLGKAGVDMSSSEVGSIMKTEFGLPNLGRRVVQDEHGGRQSTSRYILPTKELP